MRYKVARELAKAFNGLDVTVNVNWDGDNAKVHAIKEWHGIVLVPLKELSGLSDDEAADKLMVAAQQAVKIAQEKQNG